MTTTQVHQEKETKEALDRSPRRCLLNEMLSSTLITVPGNIRFGDMSIGRCAVLDHHVKTQRGTASRTRWERNTTDSEDTI